MHRKACLNVFCRRLVDTYCQMLTILGSKRASGRALQPFGQTWTQCPLVTLSAGVSRVTSRFKNNPRVVQARREHGLQPFYAQDNVFHGARVLVNTAFGFEYPHGLAPLVEMTGPLLPPRVARALSAAAVPPPLPRSSVRLSSESQDANGVDSDSTGSGGKQGWGGGGDVDEDDDPLALPFLIRTWLGGTGALVAPGTAAFEAAAKQTVSAKQRVEAAAAATSTAVSGKEDAATYIGEGPLLPDDNGVIYVNLGRMPQLDKWQLVTILQALSPPSEAMCWGGGGVEDRLGPYRVLWVLPAEQREQLLSALLPMAPPPSFRLKVLGGLPHLGVSFLPPTLSGSLC